MTQTDKIDKNALVCRIPYWFRRVSSFAKWDEPESEQFSKDIDDIHQLIKDLEYQEKTAKWVGTAGRAERLALWADIIMAATEALQMETSGRLGDPNTWPCLRERALRIIGRLARLREVTP